MQFWHRVICVTDLESYFLLPFHVLHPVAHCASTVVLLLTFVHRNKPSFLFPLQSIYCDAHTKRDDFRT